MNEFQAENLRILIRYMETNPVEQLHMCSTRTYKCGTPACAIGHARSIEALVKRGINEIGGVLGVACDSFGMQNEYITNRKSWMRLFGASVVVWSPQETRNFLTYPTPREWAAEARKVLSESGYSMDGDGFDKFMAKVREPVAVTA